MKFNRNFFENTLCDVMAAWSLFALSVREPLFFSPVSMDFLGLVVEIVGKPWFLPTVLVTIVLLVLLHHQRKWSHLKKYKKLASF